MSRPYRLKNSLIAIIHESDQHLEELPAGAIFYAADRKPDSRGMIEGMCQGHTVQIFACDLEEQAEPLATVP